MNPQDTLFGRDAEAERESVVARPAMDPHPIGASGPEPMIRNAVSEEPQERPLQPEAQEPDLPAVRMTRQHEVCLLYTSDAADE